MYQDQYAHKKSDSMVSSGMDTLSSSGDMAMFGSSKFGKYLQTGVEQIQKDCGVVECACYSLCFCVVVLGYHMFSDGVFSSLITLASVVQFLGLVLTLVKVEQQKSFGNLSINMLQLYVPIYVLRLMCTLFHEGYLPADASGDWAYQIADICALAIVCLLLWKAHFTHLKQTVKEEQYFPSLIIAAFCCGLACVIFPRHNLGIWADTFWTGSLYLETFVMIPQVRLIAKEMNVESLTSHSIACTFFYRFINFYFWVVCRLELVRERDQDYVPGYFVVGALAIQTVLLCDFIYFYGKALVEKNEWSLPTFEGCFSV